MNEQLADVALSKSGVTINFQTKKNLSYNIYRIINGKNTLISQVNNNSGLTSYLDRDVFSYDEVDYLIQDETKQVLNKSFKVRPKDYLINLLNSELLSGKKKWYV